MHARNRTWALGSNPAERCRQRTMPVEGGDGSTLSLDFTSGVLDPRLTFTRLGNATFINSSGLVEWANANFWFNTAFAGISGTDPTLTNVGWQYVFSVATTTFNGDGTVTISTTGGTNRGGLARVTSIPNTTLRLATAVDIVAHTGATYGTLTVSDLFSAGAFNDIQFYIDGNPVSSTTPISGPCTVTWVFERTGGGTITPSFGVNLRQARTGAFTLRFANPRFSMWGGVAPLPYYANTSSGASPSERHDPRFDYDPTTIGSPRGLLIEGSATNICTYSGDLTQSGAGHWSVRTALITTSWTGFTAPDGTATAVKIIPDTTSSRHTIESSSTTVVSGTTYTASAFVKADGYSVASIVIAGGQTRRNFTLSGLGTVESQFGLTNTATITPVGNNGWYRITMTWTANATGGAGLWIGVPQNATTDVVSSWSGNGTSAIQAWGAQLETGSGASSYIPTGASQGSRAADSCYIYDTTSSGGLSWLKTATQGTFYVEMFKRSAGTAFAAAGYGTRGTSTQDFMLYQSVGNNWLSFNWGAGENIVNYTALSSPFLIKSAAALSPRVGTPTTADVLQSINGTAGTLNTSPNVGLPFASDLFCIGSRGPAGGTAPSQNYAETAIRHIKFFPFAMTSAQMNAMTTL